MQSMLRRRFTLGGMIAGMLPLSSCGNAPVLCPTDPSISSRSSPLTIDTHAHIFNGRDLQIREFLSQTTVGPTSDFYKLVNAMSGILQGLAWNRAPSAQEERVAIAKYAQGLKQCGGTDQMRNIASDALQDGYSRGREELQRVLNRIKNTTYSGGVLSSSHVNSKLDYAISTLPESFRDFERPKSAGVLQSDPTARGYIRFVLHQFNHRHANAIDYLTTYSKGSTRKVDLVVTSMVDYDYWLNQGYPTPTNLNEQVELMGEITKLLGGRIHGFVPFCPFRDAMTINSTGEGASMRLIKRAVEDFGFVGVKIYPPMGFAALGNAGKSVWQGKGSLLPAASDPDFGKHLDNAMRRLYKYCLSHDVPIMAHTNNSNGPYREFEALAGSDYWDIALKEFPGLSVNFGHFGDSDPEDHHGNRSRKFLKLMTKGVGTSGERVFADTGYFAGATLDYGKMTDVLSDLYAQENKILLERLMYGSDWSMTLKESRVASYLADFMEVISRLENGDPVRRVRNQALSNAFFGQNAVEFLGLKSNRGNRTRLERFYSRHRIPTPDWMSKVDSSRSPQNV